MGATKQMMLEQMEREEEEARNGPQVDEDDDRWVPIEAKYRGKCCHCGEHIEPGDALLMREGDDNPRKVMHRGCWELHDGFIHAMNRDD